MLGIFHDHGKLNYIGSVLLSSADFFSKSTFSKKKKKKKKLSGIYQSVNLNSLDPDQARRSVGSDLCPSC